MKKDSFLLFLFLLISGPLYLMAQISSSKPVDETGTSIGDTPKKDIVKAQAAVNEVLLKAGMSFKEGLLAYKDNKRREAGAMFNKSVEVFLYSTININSDIRLQTCYEQLIETIFRIEFPADNSLPLVRNLTMTCGWSNIDTALADKIATLVKNSGKTSDIASSSVATANQVDLLITGFNPQEFETSPLDALSRLELTLDEQQVEAAPISPRQNQYIPYAVPKNPRVPVSKVKNTKLANSSSGETWQNISNRTGVSVADLMAANQGMAVPRGKVFVPLAGNAVKASQYSRPPKTESVIDLRPAQSKDGKVVAVMNYFNETLDDPYSMKFVRWSPLSQVTIGGVSYWAVTVKVSS